MGSVMTEPCYLLIQLKYTWHALVESFWPGPCAALSVCVHNVREPAGVRIQHTLGFYPTY